MDLLYPKAYFNSIHASLVYGVEAMVPIEVMVHSDQLALLSKFSDPNDRIYDIEALEE